ncbi:MAG: tetratricopeptide repeat protein [Defluviitaleaceae bacterium]|nr:tetratricopeptide repeat protein [Defluviitaleaceae bacterium]
MPNVKRNLIVIGSAMGLYGLYVLLILVLGLDFWVILAVYAVVIVTLYIINRKAIMSLRGNYFYLTGNLGRARTILQKAVDSGTKSPASHIYLALILMREDTNANDAFKYLDRAIELSRNPVDKRSATISKATCHWMNKDAKAAIKTLEDMRASQEYTNAPTLVSLGFLYMVDGNLAKALEITNIAIDEEADHAAAWDNLGQIRYREDRIEEAREAFVHALSLKDTLADSNYYMGIITEQDGDFTAAAEYFRKAAISPIGFFNTVTQEQTDAKYEEYRSKEA